MNATEKLGFIRGVLLPPRSSQGTNDEEKLQRIHEILDGSDSWKAEALRLRDHMAELTERLAAIDVGCSNCGGLPHSEGCALRDPAALRDRVAALQAWVDDLQSCMYVNCVYCGHRYGPGETTPVSMADALKAHVEACPQHPMSALKRRVAELESMLAEARAGA